MVQCSESSADGTELQKGHVALLLQKNYQNKSKTNPLLRAVIKLKPQQVEGRRRGGKPEDICSPFPTGCPRPTPRCGGHVSDPNPGTGGKFWLPVVEELTFRIVIPINVIFFLKHSGGRRTAIQ